MFARWISTSAVLMLCFAHPPALARNTASPADSRQEIRPDADATATVFPSAAMAFEKAILACEAVYTGALRGEKSDPTKLGPFSQRGFYMSATGDEAKVNGLMLGRFAHVFKGSVKDGAGVVYILFSRSPVACRVGSFDASNSHASALQYLAKPHSGWVAQPTKSPSAKARMQLFDKQVAGTTATLNVSWPVARGTGPNGLSAMATMVLTQAPASAIR